MDNNKNMFESVTFLNEGTLGSIIIAAGVVSAVSGVSYLIDKALKSIKKNKPESAKQIEERLRKTKEENKKRKADNEKFVEDVKKSYGISLEVVNKEFKNENDTFDSIEKDCKQWLSKILNSKVFESNIKILVEEDPDDLLNWLLEDYSTKNTSISFFKSIFKIIEGVDGVESIEVVDTQVASIVFGWVIEDLARMLEISYENYISGVNTGDGDEGTIYYTMK